MAYENSRKARVSYAALTRLQQAVKGQPGLTIPEYADIAEVDAGTANKLVRQDWVLWHYASNGKIAISTHGKRPDWYADLPDQSLVPVRSAQRVLPASVGATGINDAAVAEDVNGILKMAGFVGRKISARKRRSLIEEMTGRTLNLGQQVDESLGAYERLEKKIEQLEAKALMHDTLFRIVSSKV